MDIGSIVNRRPEKPARRISMGFRVGLAVGLAGLAVSFVGLGHSRAKPFHEWGAEIDSRVAQNQPQKAPDEEVKTDPEPAEKVATHKADAERRLKTRPKPEPKPEPRVEPKPEPKVIQVPKPKPEPVRQIVEPKPTSGIMGKLAFYSTPNVKVYDGGKLIGQTPFFGKSIGAGAHKLRVKNPSMGINEVIDVNVPENRGIKVKLLFIKQKGEYVLMNQKKTQL